MSMIVMKSKYRGKCSKCGSQKAVGTPIQWNTDTKKVTCHPPCGLKPLPPPGEQGKNKQTKPKGAPPPAPIRATPKKKVVAKSKGLKLPWHAMINPVEDNPWRDKDYGEPPF